uniref:OPA3-like protein CG13603 n=1 Tax=Strongyloides venezuelensis TaxID=75913 RepID=A0A0K0FT38_STRVS
MLCSARAGFVDPTKLCTRPCEAACPIPPTPSVSPVYENGSPVSSFLFNAALLILGLLLEYNYMKLYSHFWKMMKKKNGHSSDIVLSNDKPLADIEDRLERVIKILVDKIEATTILQRNEEMPNVPLGGNGLSDILSSDGEDLSIHSCNNQNENQMANVDVP